MQFRTLNTGKAPCFDDPLYSEAKCHLECFQNEIKNSLGCKMPYMAPASGAKHILFSKQKLIRNKSLNYLLFCTIREFFKFDTLLNQISTFAT